MKGQNGTCRSAGEDRWAGDRRLSIPLTGPALIPGGPGKLGALTLATTWTGKQSKPGTSAGGGNHTLQNPDQRGRVECNLIPNAAPHYI